MLKQGRRSWPAGNTWLQSRPPPTHSRECPSPDFSPRLDAFRGLPEGRGFSPAEIAAPALCWSRAPRSLRLVAAATVGRGTQE